ncbi:MAG: hypothetical protein VX871_04695 [Pseudomonadota bacterium]|nr:hypothetical protein [Pseudomonadota bacterium]
MSRIATLTCAAALACIAAAPAWAGGFNAWLDRNAWKYEPTYWKPAWAYYQPRGYDACKDGIFIGKRRCHDNRFYDRAKINSRAPVRYHAAK